MSVTQGTGLLMGLLFSWLAHSASWRPVEDDQRRVYIAGPLFNQSERREQEQIARELEREGFITFVPHRDGFLLSDVQNHLSRQLAIEPGTAMDWTARAVDALDVYQVIAGTGSLVANINGRVPDEGTLVELTMAWMLGKPVILVGDDSRSLINGLHNPLLMGRGDFEIISPRDRIGLALKKAIGKRPIPIEPFQVPNHVEMKVLEGERLWLAIKASLDANKEEAAERTSQLIIEMYGKPCPDYF